MVSEPLVVGWANSTCLEWHCLVQVQWNVLTHTSIPHQFAVPQACDDRFRIFYRPAAQTTNEDTPSVLTAQGQHHATAQDSVDFKDGQSEIGRLAAEYYGLLGQHRLVERTPSSLTASAILKCRCPRSASRRGRVLVQMQPALRE